MCPPSNYAPAASWNAWRWFFKAPLLVRHGHPAVADAFCASRLDGDRGLAFGTLPPGLDLAAIIERATPKLG